MATDFYAQTNSPAFFSALNRELKSDTTKSIDCQAVLDNRFSAAFSKNQIRFFIEENINRKNYAVAISLIDELINLDPYSAVNYNNRGLMHFRDNQLSKAIDDLTRALEIDPQLDRAYNNRANCYAARGDLIAAISDYDEALDLNPTNFRASINQGITFRELGSYDLALENFDTVLILSHAFSARAYGERGRTYHLQGDWNCAVADYQTAIKLLSGNSNKKGYRAKVKGWLDDLLDPILSY